MKRIRVVGLVVLLVACAHTPDPPMPVYLGGPLDAVVKRMGYPTSQRDFQGLVVYSWVSDVPEAHMIFGRIHQTCTMDVAATRENVVKDIKYNGTPAGCEYLQDRLMAP